MSVAIDSAPHPRQTTFVIRRLAIATCALLFTHEVGHAQTYVHADSTHLVAETQSHWVGVNAAVMHGNSARTHANDVLAAAQNDGLNVVRIWALGEYAADAPPWTEAYAFSRWATSTATAPLTSPQHRSVAPSFAHLDSVLVEAQRRGLKVILVLANRWADFGGIPAYLRALRGDFSAPATPPTQADIRLFLENEVVREMYRTHLTQVVERTNAITGMRYADDPTIFSYELINEISVPPRDAELLYQWVDWASGAIREHDTSHMISAGHIGYATERDRATWRGVCARPNVSYCDHHAYPLEEGRPIALRDLRAWIADRMTIARALNKPMLFGEFGFSTVQRRVQTQPRARWLQYFLRESFAQGAAGALLWSYQFAVDREHEHRVGVEDAELYADLRSQLRAAALGQPQRRSTPERELWSSRWQMQTQVTHRETRSGLRFSVTAFSAIDLDGAALYVRGQSPHLYGLGPGTVRYRIRTAAHASSRLRFYASSEVRGSAGDAHDVAAVEVQIDDRDPITLNLPPDDGVGMRFDVPMDNLRAGVHEITFRVVTGVGVESLCLYDRDGDPGIELAVE